MRLMWQTDSQEELTERRYHCDAKWTGNRDIDLLARLIFAEAAGEPSVGKEAVGCVVRNRVEAPSKYSREFGRDTPLRKVNLALVQHQSKIPQTGYKSLSHPWQSSPQSSS